MNMTPSQYQQFGRDFKMITGKGLNEVRKESQFKKIKVA